MTTQNLHHFMEVLERNYKSLHQPDFSFVSRTISSKPYDALIKHLQVLFNVEEITDPNDDVSFRYIVSNLNSQWVVELSMLGAYATLLRVSQAAHIELVTQDTSTPEDRNIISLLLEYHFSILGKDDLEQPVNLNLFNTEPDNVCIYQALFSDTDTLPWKG